MQIVEVELAKLSPPPTRDVADPDKLDSYGSFSWNEYTPITVTRSGRNLVILDGMTRVELARRAGIRKLPAYVFDGG